MAADAGRTDDGAYTDRLTRLGDARWKRWLDVQAPYRRNLRRLVGGRAVLDVGCGIGRHLRAFDAGSVGVDHNPTSVAVCRDRGLEAYTADEFFGGAMGPARGFDALLAAHLLEHLEPGTQVETLRPYVERLAPGATIVLVCPQPRGYRSDATHREYLDDAALAAVLRGVGADPVEQSSFPLPRWAGSVFTHNEFVSVGILGGDRA